MDWLEIIRRRAEIVRGLRAFFDEQCFVEVMTPVRIAAPAPEPHIDCPRSGDKYLRASPELQMKKLLAAGLEKFYQIGPCFREGELGSRHNPEFTMIEWYRKYADYRVIREDMKELIGYLSEPGFRKIEFAELSVRDAYLAYAGWDPWEDWDQDRFDYDMATKIEPNLPKGYVFLIDYPPQAASLAKLSTAHDARCTTYAERWELYFNGIELANCFTELCDGPEQRRRFREAKAERKALGESDYPLDEEFLELVPLMESAAGVALGVDRLVAALLGEKDIHAVMIAE